MNTEPLILFGEGNYALTAVKEIDGTEEFLRLDEGIKHCQNRETFQECQAKEYIKDGLVKCKCTPYEMRNYSQTVSCRFFCIWLFNPSVQETLCMPPGLECYKSLNTYSEKCIIPCKGSYADVSKGDDFKKVEEIEKLRTTLDDYKDYKSGFFNGTEGSI